MEERLLSSREKARIINLNTNAYGSFAEIGAGQEVAAIFFKAGGASQTVAKTMSAYDMTFSNAIYGSEESGRYVCEPRVVKMLNHEYKLLEERLGDTKGKEKAFFAFAATVTTINFQKTSQGHGWLGVQFQLKPETQPNQLIVHLNMHDRDVLAQQQVVGTVGANMIYACYHHTDDIENFVNSLMDNLSRENLDIDMVRLQGPDFDHVDNRLLSLYLVENGHTDAAMFAPDGHVVQPSDLLYKKNILALRGRFRPVTNVNMDMLRCGSNDFLAEKDVDPNKVVTIAELTLNDLGFQSGDVDKQDFLDRVDILSSLGVYVMISNYQEYYKLVSYFSQQTKEKIGIVLGVYNLESIFDEKYYEKLKGGILESFSTLFSRNVKLYVYPALRQDSPGDLYTCINFRLPHHLEDLYEYLIANQKIDDITDFDYSNLNIFSDKVLEMIRLGKGGWERLVPEKVASAIKEKKLFGYKPAATVTP
ncbi:MAG: TonB-dependent receptor [Cytophagales bacterium]|nr:MAG: TonB-dependent receptor [Cytophagales bacterium]